MFKVLLLILVASIGPGSARALAAGRIVVSDYDDTIKISNTQNKLDTIRRGIFTKALYAGAVQNAQALTDVVQFYVLSSSPTIFNKKVERLFTQVQFPEHQLILRQWFKEKSSDFKIRHLREIAAATPGARFVLFGDDTERDPEIYQQFEQEFPGRVEAIFIHRVAGRAIPAGSYSFATWFDAALIEQKLGLVAQEAPAKVGRAILEQHISYTIPGFMECPAQGPQADPTLSAELKSLQSEITKKIQVACQE